MGKVFFTEEVRFNKDPVNAREFSLMNICEESIPGRGNGESRGPRAGPCLVYSRSSKEARMVGTDCEWET